MRATMTVDGSRNEVTALIATALEAGILAGLSSEEAIPAKRHRRAAPRLSQMDPPFREGERVMVSGKTAKHGDYDVEPGMSGVTISDAFISGRGHAVHVALDSGRHVRLPVSLLARKR